MAKKVRDRSMRRDTTLDLDGVLQSMSLTACMDRGDRFSKTQTVALKEFFHYGEFPEEHYLVAAIERHLQTESQRKALFEKRLSIEKILNGRYGDADTQLVRNIFRAWNVILGRNVDGQYKFGNGEADPPEAQQDAIQVLVVAIEDAAGNHYEAVAGDSSDTVVLVGTDATGKAHHFESEVYHSGPWAKEMGFTRTLHTIKLDLVNHRVAEWKVDIERPHGPDQSFGS